MACYGLIKPNTKSLDWIHDWQNLLSPAVCYACSYHYEKDSFRIIPTMKDINAMLVSDALDQIQCNHDRSKGQPLKPRVWPAVRLSLRLSIFLLLTFILTMFHVY